MPQKAAWRTVLYDLADRIADRDYPRLPASDRPRIRRRLGKLTRKSDPVPGQRRSTAVGRLQTITRGARSRPRWRPLRAAAAFAVAVIAGVIGGKLTGKLTPALAAFAVLLVAGVILVYRAEPGADAADTQDAERHPK
jgi:hypothetical protein